MKTKDGREIHWDRAKDSARMLVDTCESALSGFTPPEHAQTLLNHAAQLLGLISDSLRLSRHELSAEVASGLSAHNPAAEEWLRSINDRFTS